MRLVWSAFALADRDAIFTHIEAENRRTAIAVDERIATARRLVDFSQSGRPDRVAGARERGVTFTPYIVAFTVTADMVRMLRVLHGAQRWPEELPEG